MNETVNTLISLPTPTRTDAGMCPVCSHHFANGTRCRCAPTAATTTRPPTLRLVSTSPLAIVALEAHLGLIRGALKGAVNPTDTTADGVTTIEMPWSRDAEDRIAALSRSSKLFGALWRIEKIDGDAAAPSTEDRSFTCRCGRFWVSRSMQTAGGCFSCAPESAWSFDESRRAVAVPAQHVLSESAALLERQ